MGQNVALGVTPGMPGAARADGFPSAQEVLSQVDAADLNKYACNLEDSLNQHAVALEIAADENLKLRHLLLSPTELSSWAQYMFGQGGPFDVTADPQYQNFVQVWNAAGLPPEQAYGAAGYEQAYTQPVAQPGYDSPLYQPASTTSSLEEQIIQQQAEMQQQLAQQQAPAQAPQQFTQQPARQGFPAPPTPAVGNIGVEQFRQAFYSVAPEQRSALIKQAQAQNPNLIRQMAAGMFQF
jgi:hypothetical protein